jgi:G protein-coupled receptor 107
MNLPLVFFYFSVSYGFCSGWWISNIRKIQTDTSPGKPTIYAIHHLMSALIVVKTVTVLLESIRYHYLRVVGHAELWSFVYYTFAFLKGTFLFVVILLIGSGWSIVKPFLNGSEKKVILTVLVLQVINNIALTVLSQETEGESSFEGWTAILHLVDIICCCAVLVPIVWQVNQLEKSVIVEDPDHPDFNGDAKEETSSKKVSNQDGNIADMGEKGRILAKLKLFRTFYLLVVAYIYSTRILVYLFAAMLNYKQLWIRYFVVEVVTLSFYVVTGYYFRPTVDGPYQGVKKEENDGDDDDFINERELEMS